MTINNEVWKTAALSKTYLEGVRGAIPLAAEQLDVMRRIIRMAQPNLKTFLDLGCGDGILGRVILNEYTDAKGIFLDFSEAMIAATKQQIGNKLGQAEFIVQDYGEKSWFEAIPREMKFDVIVSGFSIHHQPNERKKEIYQEIYSLLQPGGFFLNLEHVCSKSSLIENVFNELFIDSLYAFHQQNGSVKSKDEIAREYYNRPDKEANILAPVETQCDWLKDIGFVNVDCFFKIFELALFGGMRPKR